MELTQFNKLIDSIPNPDIVIYMGCNVSCPYLSGKYSENWGLEDPTGKSDEVFLKTIEQIEQKIKLLKVNLMNL